MSGHNGNDSAERDSREHDDREEDAPTGGETSGSLFSKILILLKFVSFCYHHKLTYSI